MPITDDFLEHDVLGREFKRGFAQGHDTGMIEGARRCLRRQLEARFGSLPAWANRRIGELSFSEAEDLCPKLLSATSIDEFLR
jgi:hypothetical protein